MPCDKSSAKRQNERQSSIDVASNAPPKSPVSSSQDEVAPHIILQSRRPQLGEFVPRAAKRLYEVKGAGCGAHRDETGPTSTWLWTELKRLGLPVICIDARHAKAVLKMQINKSDRNDSIGIARIMQTVWFKEVHVKDIDSHSVRALLGSRALLVKIKRDLENQARGLFKNLGLVIGRGTFNVFAVRAEELIEDRPELVAAVRPLLEARNAVEQQVRELDRKVTKLARRDAQVRRFMTVPGVGPVTALAFKATIDDPARFARSRSVGAYVGLTSRRHASGEVDWSGRISKCGDAMLRCYLFEAAGVLLTRVPKWSTVKAWGTRLAKRNGLRKGKVAVARKLAVILHRMWIDGTEFNWSKEEIAA